LQFSNAVRVKSRVLKLDNQLGNQLGSQSGNRYSIADFGDTLIPLSKPIVRLWGGK